MFSAKKTTFDPQTKGCLIIGQPRHLQTVTYGHFAEKLSPRVDATVRKYLSFRFSFLIHFIFSAFCQLLTIII